MILFGNRAKPSFSARYPSIRRRLLSSRASRRLPRAHPEHAARHHDLDSRASSWRKLYSTLWRTPDGIARILPFERHPSPDRGFRHTLRGLDAGERLEPSLSRDWQRRVRGLNYGQLRDSLKRGFATARHRPSGGRTRREPGPTSIRRRFDFGYRAVHLTTRAQKPSSTCLANATKSYFDACPR
jgi:hypothetical protein